MRYNTINCRAHRASSKATRKSNKTNTNLFWMCVVHHQSPCCVPRWFMYVRSVLFLFWLSTWPLRECPRAGRFRAFLLLHTTYVHFWCNWRASCVCVALFYCGGITKKKQNKSPRGTVLENLAAHHLCAFLVYHDSRATMIRGLAVRRNNKPKTKNQLKKQGWVGLNKHAYSVESSLQCIL